MPTSIDETLARSRTQWTSAAGTWDREGETISASTRAVTEALIAAAGISPGMRVLDVAGGTGDPSLRLAPLIGPGGHLVCSDLTPAMLAGARRRLALGGATGASFTAASGEALPFADGAFDAVVSRFGVMLFAEPAAGVREMARVARRGAPVAAAVWGLPERNPYFALPSAVMQRLAALPPPDPDAPGVFRLAAPGALAGLFAAAGLAGVTEDRRAFVMEAEIPLDEFWPFLLRIAAPLRTAVSALDAEMQDRVAAEVRREVAPFFASGGMRFPAEIVVARGVRAR